MKFWNGCRKAVYAALFVLLILMSAYIFYGALDTLEHAEAFQAILQGKKVPLFLAGTSFLLCVFLAALSGRLAPYLERHERIVVPALFCMMAALQVTLVLTVRTSLRYDHLKIFDTAAALLEQETIADTHFRYYFMKYPNNIPVCLFTAAWLRVAQLFGLPRAAWMDYMKLVNLLFMNAGLYCTFRLIARHRSRRSGLIFLLLLLVNPLWYLLGQMYYTSTISLAFSMGAVWLFDQAGRQKEPWKRYLLYAVMGMALAFGYRIRATTVITMAAILIYALMEIKTVRELRRPAGLAAAVLGLVLVSVCCGQAERRRAGFDPSETGYPAVHWVMMSAQGEGQYNSADDAYTGSFSTKEERTQADLERLKERIGQMGPGGLLTLFRNKLRIAFSDGTDDVYSLFRAMQETSGFQRYVNGGRGDYLALYLHSYHGMLTGLLVLAFVLRAVRREKSFLDLLAFHILGAYLFYLIWEVDRAYSIPFMLMLPAWAVDGMAYAADRLETVREKHAAAGFLLPASGCGLIALAAASAAVVSRSGIPVREYAVLQDQETSDRLLLQTEFVQTFRTDRPFDHVDLWVANWDGAANDSVYGVEILDESGRILAEGEIVGAAAPCMDRCTIAFEKVTPAGEQFYRIHVKIKNPDCAIKTDFLYYQSGAWDLYRDGALYAPEEVTDVDLAFAVYEEK